MNLVKTTFLTGISTVIKIATGLILTKIIAVYVGPAGLAVIGQFQNFISASLNLASGAMSQGVVKYVAEYKDNYDNRAKILSNALIISCVCSLAVSLAIILFNNQISFLLLKSEKYSSIFLIFGFTLIPFSLNSLLMAILNGYREIKKYVIINIISSLVSLIFTSSMIIWLGLYGALLSYATSQTIIFFVTILFIVKSSWFKIENFTKGFNRESTLKLLKFSSIILIPALIGPITFMFIRDFISSSISLEAAGYWQAVWKISDVYLMLITSSLSIYYLPRLSEIKDNHELINEVISGYKTILPVVGIMALGIFICKDIIIRVLFADKFIAMSDLFAFQLIGDFLKISSWLLSYILVAKAMIKIVIGTEIIFYLLFAVFSVLFINKFGLIGVTYAFALDYLVYLLIMIVIFKNLIMNKLVIPNNFTNEIIIDSQ